ncbi:RimK-like ATPgrasp N-terminal domain-containing protein [bacterium]|nr:RimK-like ATPgrasp N-terminal domain-containing protein [bacterium]
MSSHTQPKLTPETRPGSAMRRATACGFLGRITSDGMRVNLAGSYDYLELPYYRSQDEEIDGSEIVPTCKEMLDAYVTPIFLEKAKIAGLPIPEYYITNSYFEPPVVVDPINPFMTKSRTVLKANRRESAARSMTRNFTYSMCCQEIPPGARIVYVRAVLGWCAMKKYRQVAAEVWRVFRIPLARLRLIVLADGTILYSDISQLPFEKLHRRELEHIEKMVTWDE